MVHTSCTAVVLEAAFPMLWIVVYSDTYQLRARRFDCIVAISRPNGRASLPIPMSWRKVNEDPSRGLTVDVCQQFESLHGRPNATKTAAAANPDHLCSCLIRAGRSLHSKNVSDTASFSVCWCCCSRCQNRRADPWVPSGSEGLAENYVGG